MTPPLRLALVLIVGLLLLGAAVSVRSCATRRSDRELCEKAVDEEVRLNRYFDRADAIRVCLKAIEDKE